MKCKRTCYWNMLVIGVVAALAAGAQAGSISGQVRDASGNNVAGVNERTSAQNQRMYDVEWVTYGRTVGPFSNRGQNTRLTVFSEDISFEDAAWLQLDLTDVVLGNRDAIVITSISDGIQQVINNRDPQFSDPGLGGRFISIIFNGNGVNVSLELAAQSKRAGFAIATIRVARGPLGGVATICGETDNRVPMMPVDPCVVRVVDMNGVAASGFMISNNWMITAHHVMTDGPWSIQRNVPESMANGTIVAPGANDQFMVANLNNSTTSGTTARGLDWAVVQVPNNAGAGANCNPTFNCNYSNTTNGAILTVDGCGMDSNDATRNHTAQTHSGPSVAGGNNCNHVKHRVDTEAGNSGSRITDDQGRIVGIHTAGECGGTDAMPTGENHGTLMSNYALVAAIENLCGVNICPSTCCVPAGPPLAGGGTLNAASIPCVDNTACNAVAGSFATEGQCIGGICYTPKNRYIEFTPPAVPAGAEGIAFRVVLETLPGPTTCPQMPDYSYAQGDVKWVGNPNSNGVANLTDAPVFRSEWTRCSLSQAACTGGPGQGTCPANQTCSINLVTLTDCEIVPCSTLNVQALTDVCPPSVPGSFSPSLFMNTAKRPGNVSGQNAAVLSPADGNVAADFKDIGWLVARFQASPTIPPSERPRVDLKGNVPTSGSGPIPPGSNNIDFNDISFAVDGFKGLTYEVIISGPGAVPGTGNGPRSCGP